MILLPQSDPGLNPLLLRNGKGLALGLLGGTCDLLGDSCGRPELSRRDAKEALEVAGALAMVRPSLRAEVESAGAENAAT
jgi:hypothetical protein